jgi:hypothetical protein
MTLSKQRQKELYTKAKFKLASTNKDCAFSYIGICTALMTATEKYDEFLEIKKCFYKNKPNLYKPRTWRFYFSKYYRDDAMYWWEKDARGLQERIKFLDYLIKTVS